MPLTFATPTPFAPGVNSAYGGAQTWSQDAPMLAGLEENIASQYAQGNALKAQAAMQSRALNQQAVSQTGALNEAGRQNAANNANQDYLANLAANTQSLNTEYNAQAQGALQNQQAQLQNWLNSQQMTQKEQMQLQQQKNAVADINSAVTSGTLTPDEGNAAIVKLKTGIDRGNMRLQNTMQQQHQQLMQNEQIKGQLLSVQAEAAKHFANSNLANTSSPTLDEGILQKYRDEYDTKNNLPALQQQQGAFAGVMGAAMPAAKGQQYDQQREAYARKKTLADPAGVTGMAYQVGPGKPPHIVPKAVAKSAKDNDEPENFLGDAESAKDAISAMKAASEQALMEMPVPINEEGKPQDTNELVQKRAARAQQIYKDMEKVHNEGVSARNKLRGKGKYITDQPSGQAGANVQSPQEARQTVAQMRNDVAANPAIPADQRQFVNNAADAALKEVERVGGYANLSPQWKAGINRIGTIIQNLQKQYPKPSPTAPPVTQVPEPTQQTPQRYVPSGINPAPRNPPQRGFLGRMVDQLPNVPF